MKRYIEINIDRYIPLFEGKKQASQMLKKRFHKEEIKEILNQFEKFDPSSPKNKYIEVLTKVWVGLLPKKDMDMDMIWDQLASFIQSLNSYGIKNKIKSIEERHLKVENLNKIKNIDDFLTAIEKVYGKKTKSMAKKGVKGLKKGKDYLEIKVEDKDTGVYIPFNNKSSIIIASNKVGYVTGEWCTAYAKNDEHWKTYIHRDEGILVYIVDYNEDDAGDLQSKEAFYYYAKTKKKSKFDRHDNVIEGTVRSSENEIDKFVLSHWDEIRKGYEAEAEEHFAKQRQEAKIIGNYLEKLLENDLGFKIKGDFIGGATYKSSGESKQIDISFTIEPYGEREAKFSMGLSHKQTDKIDRKRDILVNLSGTTNSVRSAFDSMLYAFCIDLLQLKTSENKDIKDYPKLGFLIKGWIHNYHNNFKKMFLDEKKAVEEFIDYVKKDGQEGMNHLKVLLKGKGEKWIKDIMEMLFEYKEAPTDTYDFKIDKKFNIKKVFFGFGYSPIFFGTKTEINKFWESELLEAVKYDYTQFTGGRDFITYSNVDNYIDYVFAENELGQDYDPETAYNDLMEKGFKSKDVLDPYKVTDAVLQRQVMEDWIVDDKKVYKTKSGLYFFRHNNKLNY